MILSRAKPSAIISRTISSVKLSVGKIVVAADAVAADVDADAVDDEAAPAARLLSSNAFRKSWSSISLAVSAIAFSSSSGVPVSRKLSGNSFSAKNGVSVPVVPMCKTFRCKSMLHYVEAIKIMFEKKEKLLTHLVSF